MASEATFTRQDSAEGAVFSVRPAAKPGGLGCMTTIGYLFFGGIALIALIVGVQFDLERGVPFQMVKFSVGFSAIIWLPGLLIVWSASKGTRDPAQREAVTITVDHKGLRVGGKHFPEAEIRDLVVDIPGRKGGQGFTPLRDGMSSAQQGAYNAGAAMAVAQINSSYALMVRTKASNQFEMLAFGLTPDTGRALLRDILDELRPTDESSEKLSG